MKYFILVLLAFFFATSTVTFANKNHRGKYGPNPVTILDNIVQGANEDVRVQNTQLDATTSQGAAYGTINHPITNTLYYVKNQIHYYLKWVFYFGLAAATILVIYNGFLLVTAGVNKWWDLTKVKSNLTYIGIGVAILIGLYFLLDLVVAVVAFIFG